MASPKLYKVTEVIEMLSLSRSVIYREVQAGNLKVVRIGRAVRFLDSEIERYVNALGVK